MSVPLTIEDILRAALARQERKRQPIPPLAEWLMQRWPNAERRKDVIDGYIAMAERPYLLADIALVGGVFSECDSAENAFEAGLLIGRKQTALQIIKACNTEPLLLYTYFDKRKPKVEQ